MTVLRTVLLAIAGAAMTASGASTHRLATFNTRCYMEADTEGKSWEVRGPKCSELIKKYDFDVIGLQEVNGQGNRYTNPDTGRKPMDDMMAWLPEYSFEFWDRDGDKMDEYVGVAYKKDRYELMDKGSFYISATPDVFSLGWVEGLPRRLGWTKLKDKATGEMMIFASTHTNEGWKLDGPYGSQLIAERLKTIAHGLPVMVVADYNTSRQAESTQKGLKHYHASFYDAADECPAAANYSLPKTDRNVTWTYNKFKPASDTSYTGTEIDYQFYRGMKVLERHIVTDDFTYNGKQYTPSDHFPIFVVAELAPEQQQAYYVDCNAADGGDGSLTAPYRTISQAVSRAAMDDIVYVAEGTYHESVQPTRTINIFGGYSGNFTHVEGTSVLDGEGLQYPPIYAPAYISLTLKDLTVRGYKSTSNSRDGAIHFKGSTLHMERLVIENNTAAYYGGGVSVYTINSIYCECNNVTATDCIFRSNSARYGGAMALGFYDKCVIDGCTFDGNSTPMNGSALYFDFGTPESERMWFSDAKALVVNSAFVNNTSERSGTIVINDAMPNVEVTVVNTTFAANSINARSGSASMREKFGGTAIQASLVDKPELPRMKRVRPSQLNLGHVTITGNHAKCETATGFPASALNITNGTTRIFNSIIAGNSTNGAEAYADVTVSNLEAEANNIFTAATTVSFTPANSSTMAASAVEGTNAVAAMLTGTVNKNLFNPYVLLTGDDPTPYIPVTSTMFGNKQMATITAEMRDLEKEFNTDIDRNGSIGAPLATDQLRRTRKSLTIPGAMEFGNEDAGISAVEVDENSVIVDVQPGGYVTINASQAIGTITVTDLAGRIINADSSPETTHTLRMNGVVNGIYMINCCGKTFKVLIK